MIDHLNRFKITGFAHRDNKMVDNEESGLRALLSPGVQTLGWKLVSLVVLSVVSEFSGHRLLV